MLERNKNADESGVQRPRDHPATQDVRHSHNPRQPSGRRQTTGQRALTPGRPYRRRPSRQQRNTNFMNPAPQPPQKTRIRSLLEAAHSIASDYVEIYRGGEPITMPAPRIIGPGRCDEISGVSRAVFLAAFEDALVRSHFDGIEVKGRMLFDYQGHEIDQIATEHLADKFVIEGNDTFALHEAPRTPMIEISEALNLVGNNAINFGHWIFEYILRWATVAERPELRNVPVLIDECLPASHREGLEYFLENRAPVIVLPKDATARVRKLWSVSNWIYVPINWKNEETIHRQFIVWPAKRVAARYQALACRIDQDDQVEVQSRRVFLSRRNTRHRRLTNIDEIEEIARGRGFDVYYPEDLGFRDQLRLVRGATHIMGPEGSAFFLVLFARPGTKVCCFDHPFVEKVGFVDALFRELGMDLILLTGECVRKDERFSRFSDYVLKRESLKAVLEEWDLAT